MDPNSFTLGMKVKDRVNGFTGVITGMATYLYVPDQACVESAELKDGKPVSEWIYVTRLEEVK